MFRAVLRAVVRAVVRARYQTGACDVVDPLRQWVIQSQYFYGLLNHTGVPDPSGVGWTG